MTTINQILQKLVEAVSRPDWCAIGISAVNALFLGRLAWRQYQLQKRQTKLQEQQVRQQEYAIYSQLYKLLKVADNKIDFFLDDIRNSIALAPYSTLVVYERQLQETKTLLDELLKSKLDFEIKFSKDFFDVSSYQRILTHMQFILGQMNELAKSGEIKFKSYSAAFDTNSDADIACVNHIIACITNINVINAHRNALLDFVNQKKKLRANGNDILEKIRERCKVE